LSAFADWLREIGLERYASVFAENDVDFSVVRKLTETDLKELGVTLGHRKKFLEARDSLDLNQAGEAPTRVLSPDQLSDRSGGGERRQLTVMFCDLVGSTALSEKLDPEELRALLHNYRTVCGEVISRYEGFVARYVSDGILTYFGWPKAHEEDAERALRAALEIVQAVKRASSTEALSVRIGIATGPVVVGEQAGVGEQSKLAIGSTPNLAP
jgi:class 3 adenylate cyclase